MGDFQDNSNKDDNDEINNGLDLISVRNNFYFQNYRLLIGVNFLALILIGLMTGFFYYQKTVTSGSRYFLTSPDGILIEMPPLNKHHLKLKDLLIDNRGFLVDNPKINVNKLNDSDDNAIVKYWVKKAVLTMFDYDYVNYRRTLQNLRNYFTPGAHEEFIKSLEQSKNLQTIKDSRRVVRAQIISEPEIKTEGVASGRYAWKIFIPIDIYYENITDEPLIQKVIAKLWVLRVSTIQSPFFGLSAFVVNLEPRV